MYSNSTHVQCFQPALSRWWSPRPPPQQWGIHQQFVYTQVRLLTTLTYTGCTTWMVTFNSLVFASVAQGRQAFTRYLSQSSALVVATSPFYFILQRLPGDQFIHVSLPFPLHPLWIKLEVSVMVSWLFVTFADLAVTAAQQTFSATNCSSPAPALWSGPDETFCVGKHTKFYVRVLMLNRETFL